jgi:hypothetical protein
VTISERTNDPIHPSRDEKNANIDEQDEDDGLIDVFSEFVTGWVEVQWDTVRLDEEDAQPSRITPNA